MSRTSAVDCLKTDMTLRLDNAKALPICPKQQRQIVA
jgi:hypothetical protein